MIGCSSSVLKSVANGCTWQKRPFKTFLLLIRILLATISLCQCVLVFRDTSQGFTQLIPGVDRILPLQEVGALWGNRCLRLSKTKFDLSGMTDVDSILNYTRSEEEDYYAILGCDETATVSVKVIDTACATFVFYLCFNFFFCLTFHIVDAWNRPLHWRVAICVPQKSSGLNCPTNQNTRLYTYGNVKSITSVHGDCHVATMLSFICRLNRLQPNIRCRHCSCILTRMQGIKKRRRSSKNWK